MIDIGADLQRAFDEGYEKGKADRTQDWIPLDTDLPNDAYEIVVTYSSVGADTFRVTRKGADNESTP